MKNTWIILLVVAVAVYFLFMRKRSGYAELNTSISGEEVPSLFDLPVSLECTSGPGPKAAYYSTERPGGICGDQDQVLKTMREYKIEGGIGGSLLEK